MRIPFFSFIAVFIVLFFASCSNTKEAKRYVAEAENAMHQHNFQLAKLKIDSIKMRFPKAFDEIKSGFALMQQIRELENRRNIAFCDSGLRVNEELKTEMLKSFEYIRDEKYEEKGTYYPTIYPLQTSLNQNGLRSGVSENGALFIESIFSGNTLKHYQVKVNTKNNAFAETLPVTSDGLNYAFATGGKRYEIVRYSGNNENGIAKFIYSFQQEPLTISFIGNKISSATLTEAQKKGISRSFELSQVLTQIEKLKYEKEKSEALLKYLESKKPD